MAVILYGMPVVSVKQRFFGKAAVIRLMQEGFLTVGGALVEEMSSDGALRITGAKQSKMLAPLALVYR